jgi:hypothetical protein
LPRSPPAPTDHDYSSFPAPTCSSEIRAWLAETGLDDRADLDLSLIEENERVLQIALGHLLGEERLFDFGAGAAR